MPMHFCIFFSKYPLNPGIHHCTGLEPGPVEVAGQAPQVLQPDC